MRMKIKKGVKNKKLIKGKRTTKGPLAYHRNAITPRVSRVLAKQSLGMMQKYPF